MSDPFPVGEVMRGGMLCLVSDDGTMAAAEGRDLAAVCSRLPLDRLEFWLERFSRATPHEHAIIRAAIDRIDPRGARGTLWATEEQRCSE